MDAIVDEPMAKRADRVERNDVPVKMDAEVIRKAKIVAAFRSQSLAEFLSDTLGKIIDDLMDQAIANEKGGKPAKEGRKAAK
jgi:hypothetical protein